MSVCAIEGIAPSLIAVIQVTAIRDARISTGGAPAHPSATDPASYRARRPNVLASPRQLKDAVAQNTADLAIQFQRIAQMQAELDVLRSALPEKGSARKKSPPDRLRSVAADRLHDRWSRPR